MAFDIYVIVGKLSDYNSVLKEKEDARKDEEHVVKPKLRAKENECVPNEVSNNELFKEKKEDNWIIPKNLPIDYFCKNVTTQRKITRVEIPIDTKC